jgi:hypothetical protein
VKTIARYYNVDRSDIGLIRFIFEAYDGIAVVSTLQSEKDIIVIYSAPGCEEEVAYIVSDLKRQMKMEEKIMDMG